MTAKKPSALLVPIEGKPRRPVDREAAFAKLRGAAICAVDEFRWLHPDGNFADRTMDVMNALLDDIEATK